MGSTQLSDRRRRRRLGAVLISAALIAAACSDKKDDESVGGAATTPTEDTTEATTAGTDALDTGAGTTTGDGTTPDTAEDTASTVPTQQTLPPPEMDPVFGGRLVVAGEAEVGAPWTPEKVQCDSYCYMRALTFLEPLAVVDNNLDIQPFLAESIEPNEDSTVWTIKVREGLTFTDGTPLNADAVIENLNRTFGGLLVSGATRDVAKNADGTLAIEKLDDYTFTIATGRNGDINDPVSWYRFPSLLTGQAGFIASPTWLAAADADTSLETKPVGTGPFIVQEYLPLDRMTLTRNPDYWRTDEAGNQLPYLDEIEFRVIQDSQARRAALEAGDVDVVATSDPTVVGPLEQNSDFVTLLQNVQTETSYVMLHLTKPQFQSREVRCALVQAVDKEDLINTVYGGYTEPSNGPFTPGQAGYLEDTGLPEYDPEAAATAIEEWEAANGPVTINYSTTPSGTNKAAADYLQQKWGEVGVDVTQAVAEQSSFITAALVGADTFEAFGWRNHAGQFVDDELFWWHGFSSDGYGAETKDGGISLNFGRLNDPVINDLLDQARETEDAAELAALSQDINRQFAKECWILPVYQTEWGIHMKPSVQNIGRDPLPDGGGTLQDGAGFPGQVWMASVFVAE